VLGGVLNCLLARWAFHIGGWRPAEAEWCKAIQLVQLEEKERVEKFRYQVDMMASLVGRLLLRGLIVQKLGVENREVEWIRTERGKPVVVGGCAGWDYNVSHAGEWVVLAAGVGRVGVDVMKLVDNRVDRLDEFFRLMKRQFTDMEWEAIRGKDGNTEQRQLANFFRHWTLKESYVKAVGTGLNIDLRTLNFTLGGEVEEGKLDVGSRLQVEGSSVGWRFEESLVDKEHVVCVAMETEDQDKNLEQFEVLDISQVFDLFNLHSLTNIDCCIKSSADLESCATSTTGAGLSAPLLRPLDQADFLLFSSKDHPKPF